MSFDLVVIGGGPGGYVAAIRAAQYGAKVAVVEKDALGGVCLNRGCIPTKALVSSTSLVAGVKRAAEFGIRIPYFEVDFSALMARKNAVVQQLVNGIHYLLRKNKVALFQGTGRILGPGRVEVVSHDGAAEILEGKNILVATGSEAARLPFLGYNGRTVITSNEALALESIPESLLVIGGGVIGCEFASIFTELGSKVTIVEALPVILPMAEEEVSKKLTVMFRKKGIAIHTGLTVECVTEVDNGVLADLSDGEKVKAEKVLISIGRTFNTEGLGLEEAGIELGPKREILVNDYLETNIPGIYAVGDVTNKVQLAHVASAQGLVAVENMFGQNGKRKMKYDVIPSCIFTAPEVAGVGITGQEAKRRGLNVKTGKFMFSANGKALCLGEGEGFVKFIADAETDKLMGAHIMGPHATELIAETVVAIKLGATALELAETIHAHPTLPETLMEAAEAVHGLSIHM